jgi:hypothetical protein
MPEQPTNEQYSPLALLGVVLASLLLFAVFFLGFLVAPLAVLLLFYVGFSAVDRSRKAPKRDPAAAEADEDDPVYVASADERLAHESSLRRAQRDRQTADAGLAAQRPTPHDGE